ncbi:TetR/AcrR family transcriptional regulator [Paenibacillus massiliensis]|uniref:TetR/AcrR family transcriptional regulator n=1 Tax=Paenibacillus massiliensis TaxID=225917 RepID=UPI000470F1A8|nr:TetR/AcrR family transcriptional regulator [Paenibacillus massiliensis]
MSGKRGRPRNLETQHAILNTSYELLLEHGFGAVTIEKIAEQAQVSKATIYKWWPNKAAVVMDGFMHAASARLPIPDTGKVTEDILLHVSNLVRFMTSREGQIITELIGGGQFDTALATELRSRYIQPRRQEAGQLLQRGIERGELPEHLDVEVTIDLVYGPIFYRLLVTGDPLDEGYVRSLVDLTIRSVHQYFA